MILYFSGTGNSLEVAQQLATHDGDKLLNIGEAYKYKKFEITLKDSEDLGFVFPCYGGTTPPLLDNFIKHVSLKNQNGAPFVPRYCYAVITCGAFVGDAAYFFADELLTHQSIHLDASFSVKSVGNCVSLYDMPEKDKEKKLLEHARIGADEVAQLISQRQTGHFEKRNLFGIIMSKFSNKPEKPRSGENFYTLSTCTHCGHCEEICPTNTITLIEGTPRWAELGCTQCFACIHRCPPHAIQYTKKTENRGRYINPVLLNQE